MPPTRHEIKQYFTRQGESAYQTHTPALDTALGMIKTAAVSFEHLTNNEHWDRFLSYVQASLETARKERDRNLSLCGGAVGDALRKFQLEYQYHNGCVSAYEVVMGLPLQMMQSYQDIKQSEALVQPQTDAVSSTIK